MLLPIRPSGGSPVVGPAGALSTWWERGKRVGVAWGKTVYRIADVMNYADIQRFSPSSSFAAIWARRY